MLPSPALAALQAPRPAAPVARAPGSVDRDNAGGFAQELLAARRHDGDAAEPKPGRAAASAPPADRPAAPTAAGAARAPEPPPAAGSAGVTGKPVQAREGTRAPDTAPAATRAARASARGDAGGAADTAAAAGAAGEHVAAAADTRRDASAAEDGVGRDAAVLIPAALPAPQDPTATPPALPPAIAVSAIDPSGVEAATDAAVTADGASTADAAAGACAPGNAAGHAAAVASGLGPAAAALPTDAVSHRRATAERDGVDTDAAVRATAAPATPAHRLPPAADRNPAGEHALPGLPPAEARTIEAVGQASAAGARHEALGAVADHSTGGLPSFAAELAKLERQPGTANTAAPVEVRAPVPVDAPDFLPRLGGELAILARHGVQEARVQLHPVELGPIAVQITLEGQAAQVHMAVDNAHTRALLESAMPTLAAALREQGLTLTGGGVFEQSRQGSGGQAEGTTGRAGRAGSGDGTDDEAAAGTPQPTRRLHRAGGLDLYA